MLMDKNLLDFTAVRARIHGTSASDRARNTAETFHAHQPSTDRIARKRRHRCPAAGNDLRSLINRLVQRRIESKHHAVKALIRRKDVRPLAEQHKRNAVPFCEGNGFLYRIIRTRAQNDLRGPADPEACQFGQRNILFGAERIRQFYIAPKYFHMHIIANPFASHNT